MAKVILNREACEVAFSNALLFASRDKARPILTAARFELESDTLTVVATDSYMLSVETVEGVKAEEAVPAAWGIYRDDLTEMLRLAKAARATDLELNLDVEGGDNAHPFGTFTFQGIGYGSTHAGRLLDGDYPNWRQLLSVPDGIGANVLRFNPKQLATLGKTRAVGYKAGGLPVVFTGCVDELKPIFWRVGENLSGLLMPARAG